MGVVHHDSSGPVEMYWFYLPIGYAPGLPDKWIYTGVEPPTTKSIKKVHDSGINVAWSIQIHRVSAIDSELSTMKATVQLAAEIFGEEIEDRLTDAHLDPTELTVLEVAVPSLMLDDPASESEAFDVALEAARFLQHGYGMVTEIPTRLLTHTNVVPAVPMMRGQAFTGRLPSKEHLGLFLTPSVQARKRVGSGFAVEMERLELALEAADEENPLAGLSEIRREALYQAEHEGNTVTSLMLYSIAAEVLLDTALFLLLWEEGVDPEKAFRIVRGDNVLGRTQDRVAKRLSVGWGERGDQTLERFKLDVYRLRNRVAHGGYLPTRDEMFTAKSSYFELERLVGDALAATSETGAYPRAAWVYLTDSGYASRRLPIPDAVRGVLDDATEPNWTAMFARWKRDYDRYVTQEYGQPGPDDDWDLHASVSRKGAVWFAFDPYSEHAALIEDPRAAISASQVAQINELANEMPPDSPPILSGFYWEPNSYPNRLNWQPDYLIADRAVDPMLPPDRTEGPPGADK